MKYLRILIAAAMAALTLMAVVGAGSASATTLEVGGVTKNEAITITASLEGSALLKDEFGTTTDTCTGSHLHGVTTSPYTTAGQGELDGNLSSLSFSSCSHTTDVIKPGKLWIRWDGGTNGTVTSSEAEVTVQSTFFGASAICKTGTGTDLGTLTGVGSTQQHATIHVNAKINCGILGTATWTAPYWVTTPTGLGVEE